MPVSLVLLLLGLVIFSGTNVYYFNSDHIPSYVPNKFMQVPAYKNLYTYYFQMLLKKYFNPYESSTFMLFAKQLNEIVSSVAMLDQWHSLDYYWPYDEVVGNLNNTYSRNYLEKGYYTMGLREFVRVRYETAIEQLHSSRNEVLVN